VVVWTKGEKIATLELEVVWLVSKSGVHLPVPVQWRLCLADCIWETVFGECV